MTNAPHDNDKPHIDEHTGVATTGHEWDGIRELNQPLPLWWLYIFYASIVFSIGYWVVYPSWPLVTGHLTGALGWNARTQILADMEGLEELRGPMVARLTSTDIADIQDDPELFDFTIAYAKAAFGDNCAPCHGAGGGGAVGYASLRDDAWLWGGSIDEIHHTIAYGVRNDHVESHVGEMPAFGRDGLLPYSDIVDVAAYVSSLSGQTYPEAADAEAGATIFADNCAACHGDDATGNAELGAPNLADAIWLYGSDYETIMETVRNGRAGAMPAWEPRLGETTVKALAVYVHTLGGGE